MGSQPSSLSANSNIFQQQQQIEETVNTKKFLDNLMSEKQVNKALANEFNNHRDFEKKLNNYSNLYRNYSNVVEKNLEKISSDRKNLNELYYMNVTKNKYMEKKYRLKKVILYTMLAFVIIFTLSSCGMIFKVIRS